MNKKLMCALAAALFVGGMTAATQASVLVSDSFSYADGDLVGNTPTVGQTWATHSGTGTPVEVSNGTISLNQGSGSRQDVNVGFDGGVTAADHDVFYASFDLNMADPGAAISPSYFAHYLAGSSSFASRVWVTTPNNTGYRIALSNGSSLSPATGAAAFSDDLAFGTTYTIGVSYDYSNASSELWVVPGSDQTIDFTTGGLAATDPGFNDAVDAFAFRQAAGNTVETIDNLHVSMITVPEPASLGIIAAAGLLALRRRRNQSI